MNNSENNYQVVIGVVTVVLLISFVMMVLFSNPSGVHGDDRWVPATLIDAGTIDPEVMESEHSTGNDCSFVRMGGGT